MRLSIPPVVLLMAAAAATPAAAQNEQLGADEECVYGAHQSPILLAPPFIRDEVPLGARYPAMRDTFAFNTGLMVQVNFAAGDSAWLSVGGRRYALLQMHFHRPTEHRGPGGAALGQVEVHLVHSDGHGEAVLATFVRARASDNPAWSALLRRPPAPGDTVRLAAPLDLGDMLALGDLNAEPVWRYAGSLTTPPYCQGVTWLVRGRTIEWSAAQHRELERVTPQLRRLPMPRNGREIHRRQ